MSPLVRWASAFDEPVRHGYWMRSLSGSTFPSQLCDARVSLASPDHWIATSAQPEAKCVACLNVLAGLLGRAISS